MNKLIYLLLLLSGTLMAQSPIADNISWKSDILFDSIDRATMPFASEFRVYPLKKKIDWLQNNGSYVTAFTINEVQGRWFDLKADGKVIFSVSYLGRNGQLVIERTGGSARVGLRIMEGDRNLLPLSFSINSVSSL